MALPAALSAELVKPVTAPVYLIQINFSPIVRYSTRDDVTYNSQTWIDIGARVSQITSDSISGRTAELILSNHDNAVSALILAQGIRQKRCQVWQAYSESVTIPADQATKVFDGFLSEVPEMATRVVLKALALAEVVLQSPRYRILPPVCNHLPPIGTKISWNGDTFTLERA